MPSQYDVGEGMHLRNVAWLLVLGLALSLTGCAGKAGKPENTAELAAPLPPYEPRPANLTPEQKYVEQLLDKNGYNGNGSKPTVIVVHKLARKLTLYRGTTLLKTYPIVLGNDPYNDKLCQGDTCTPEGIFHVRAKYPHPKWEYFIWLDYPNTKDWLKYARARKAGRLAWDSDIGGQVGIHGTEDPLKNLSGENWTKGCISLLNRHLEEIYPLVNEKTTLIVIEKQ